MALTKMRTIQLQIFTRVSPKSAFKAISDPELLKRWLLDGATLSLRRGGRYSFTWDSGPTHTGKVLEFVPEKQITLTWQWPGQEDMLVTRLKLEIEPKNAGTVVKLTHSGFPKQERWVDLYGGSIQGWMYFLMNLKSVLDHGQDLRSQYDW
ncbi:MAG TPA: SRPBCC domain-containing protein [Thermoplasmata archaeon]|nr:SRPBCC domain-containing protein [Thermoplasmata archaeon]